MKGKILVCLSAALLGAAIALPNPVMAFRSGGGFGGMCGGFGVDGVHFGGAASVGGPVTSLPGKDMAMRSSNKRFRTVKFEDGSVAVVQTDPSTPRLLEVVARFSDASHARTTQTQQTTGLTSGRRSHRRRIRWQHGVCGPVDEAAAGGVRAIRRSRVACGEA